MKSVVSNLLLKGFIESTVLRSVFFSVPVLFVHVGVDGGDSSFFKQ